MKAVESKFLSFPWAFIYPDARPEQTFADHAGEVNRWLLDNNLRYNRDYLSFEFTEEKRSFGFKTGESVYMAMAFKDRGNALMFKMAWA